jgi:uncharacterized membrane protein YsdA (DUF1294 family)/cold shock CspA family protein
MRVQGKITDWNDVRGFGFVLPLEGGERVFVHILDCPAGRRRPINGEFVNYTLGADERGRPRATQVTYVVRPNPQATPIAFFVATGFLGGVTLLAIAGRLWWPVSCLYIVMSIFAYHAYKHDKRAAEIGTKRTYEWYLIILGLIGGWPGALVARHRFRHKTRKLPFLIGYWLSVVLNVAGLAWLIVG